MSSAARAGLIWASKFKLDELMASDAQLLGRVTYQGFAKAWPTVKDEAGFADKMNAMPKYVVSSTLSDPAWNNSTAITMSEVRGLKDRYQGDILVAGSGQLVRALTDLGLADEYRLMVFPHPPGPDGITPAAGRMLW